MAIRLQLRRGTTAENESFVGAAGELTYDTATNEVRIHDGSTAGGHKLSVLTYIEHPSAANGYVWVRKYDDGWVEQGGIIPANNYTGTVALPVTMADTNYYISVTAVTDRTSASFDDELYPRELLTTGFVLRNFSGGQYKGGRWEVKGMAAA